jgi:hypothetical protein
VAGRPAAVLGPVSSRTWRHWGDIREAFAQPVDDDWAGERDLVDGALTDPWARR